MQSPLRAEMALPAAQTLAPLFPPPAGTRRNFVWAVSLGIALPLAALAGGG